MYFQSSFSIDEMFMVGTRKHAVELYKFRMPQTRWPICLSPPLRCSRFLWCGLTFSVDQFSSAGCVQTLQVPGEQIKFGHNHVATMCSFALWLHGRTTIASDGYGFTAKQTVAITTLQWFRAREFMSRWQPPIDLNQFLILGPQSPQKDNSSKFDSQTGCKTGWN